MTTKIEPGTGSQIYAFIKAVKKEYFESFINEGEICMNTAKWFRDYEQTDINVGDAGEGAIASCGTNFLVRFADPIVGYSTKEELDEKLKNANWSVPMKGESLRMYNQRNANILSLYAITVEGTEKKSHIHYVPQKFMEEFSNHRFVLITNPKNFTTSVGEKLMSLGKRPFGCIVRYYTHDNLMRQNLTFFDKQDKYSYQNEYRILSQDKNPEMLIFKIGSLREYSLEIDLYENYYVGNYGELELTIRMENGN
jgi:hypothetical protein